MEVHWNVYLVPVQEYDSLLVRINHTIASSDPKFRSYIWFVQTNRRDTNQHAHQLCGAPCHRMSCHELIDASESRDHSIFWDFASFQQISHQFSPWVLFLLQVATLAKSGNNHKKGMLLLVLPVQVGMELLLLTSASRANYMININKDVPGTSRQN